MTGKFRVWDGQKMVTANDRYDGFSISMDGRLSSENPVSGKNEYMTDSEIKRHKVMWWTGMQDKHGKEIYGGDIIKFRDIEEEEDPIVGYIDFQDGIFVVRLEGGELYRFWNDGIHDWHTVEYLNWETTEILGNTTESPELLKQGVKA